jgi:hypothetical protein
MRCRKKNKKCKKIRRAISYRSHDVEGEFIVNDLNENLIDGNGNFLIS